jgi:hypothetical protein
MVVDQLQNLDESNTDTSTASQTAGIKEAAEPVLVVSIYYSI